MMESVSNITVQTSGEGGRTGSQLTCKELQLLSPWMLSYQLRAEAQSWAQLQTRVREQHTGSQTNSSYACLRVRSLFHAFLISTQHQLVHNLFRYLTGRGNTKKKKKIPPTSPSLKLSSWHWLEL